jgi:hypothetical protein
MVYEFFFWKCHILVSIIFNFVSRYTDATITPYLDNVIYVDAEKFIFFTAFQGLDVSAKPPPCSRQLLAFSSTPCC